MVCDKIPALLLFFDTIALHVTRAVRWDSDHTVLFEDEVKEIAKEIIRCGAEQRVRIGLDYFDGGINRIAAWVSGARNMQKALLYALLMPHDHLRALKEAFRYTELLVTTEELKTLPFGAVWEEYLARRNVRGSDWFKEIAMYEANVLSKRR